MKNLILSLLAIFSLTCLSAQEMAISYVNVPTILDASQNKMLAYASTIPKNGIVRHFDWNMNKLINSSNEVVFQIPGVNNGQVLSFKVLGTQFGDNGEYTIVAKNAQGYISLFGTPQGLGGEIEISNRSFQILPFANSKGILLEKNNFAPKPSASCGYTETKVEERDAACKGDCGTSIVDVLALITPEARTWADNTWGVWSNWFLLFHTNNINSAFFLSGIPDKSVRVRLMEYTPNFPLTGNITNDRNTLSANSNAQAMSLWNGADVTMLLTNQPYGSVFGIANSLSQFSDNKFCIAQVSFIDPIRYTFAHELAHQFGCMHSSAFDGSTCPFGTNMTNGRNTIMANGAANNTRIQHFSNPDVTFDGEATGIAGTRNNAQQIRAAFCDVSDNNSLPQFRVRISGGDCGPFDFYSLISTGLQPDPQWGGAQLAAYGVGPYTYQWSWSPNASFSPSYILGTSPTLSISSAPAPNFYIRLKVISADGFEATATRSYNCFTSGGGGKDRSVTVENNVTISPNPAIDFTMLQFKEKTPIGNLKIYDLFGRVVNSISLIQLSEYEVVVNTSTTNSGIYFIQINNVGRSQIHQIIVNH